MRANGLILLGGGALARVLVDMFGRERIAAVDVDPGFESARITGLLPAARLVSQVLLMPGVVLGHDAAAQDNGVLCAGSVMGGGSVLGSDGFVGLNATIVPRIRLAAGCMVGAAALRLRVVDEASLLMGNPAGASARGPAN